MTKDECGNTVDDLYFDEGGNRVYSKAERERERKAQIAASVNSLNVLRLVALKAGYSEGYVDAAIVNLPEKEFEHLVFCANESCRFARMYQLNVPDLVGRDGWLQSSQAFMRSALSLLGIEAN